MTSETNSQWRGGLVRWCDVLPGGEIYVLLMASGLELFSAGQWSTVLPNGFELHMRFWRKHAETWNDHIPVTLNHRAYVTRGGTLDPDRLNRHSHRLIAQCEFHYVDDVVNSLMATLTLAHEIDHTGRTYP